MEKHEEFLEFVSNLNSIPVEIADIEQIVLCIRNGEQQRLLDSYVPYSDLFWDKRTHKFCAQLENEEDPKHVYLKGYVDGMTVLHVFLKYLYIENKKKGANE